MSCFSKTEEPTGEPLVDKSELRIVLLGKARVGKSASGNTILGTQVFASGGRSTATERCQKGTGKIGEQDVVVVDTPGLFPSSSEDGDEVVVLSELKQSIALARPGPHVFLIVVKIEEKYKETEKNMVELFLETFGESILDYTMVLFNWGNNLRGAFIEDYIRENKDLVDLILRCKLGYHVLENKNGNPEQVSQLMQNIRSRVPDLSESFYTPKMLKEAETALINKQVQKAVEESRDTTFQTTVYAVIGIGCLIGYLACNGEINSTIGAVVGAVGGGILGVGLATLILCTKNRSKCRCPC